MRWRPLNQASLAPPANVVGGLTQAVPAVASRASEPDARVELQGLVLGEDAHRCRCRSWCSWRGEVRLMRYCRDQGTGGLGRRAVSPGTGGCPARRQSMRYTLSSLLSHPQFYFLTQGRSPSGALLRRAPAALGGVRRMRRSSGGAGLSYSPAPASGAVFLVRGVWSSSPAAAAVNGLSGPCSAAVLAAGPVWATRLVSPPASWPPLLRGCLGLRLGLARSLPSPAGNTAPKAGCG